MVADRDGEGLDLVQAAVRQDQAADTGARAVGGQGSSGTSAGSGDQDVESLERQGEGLMDGGFKAGAVGVEAADRIFLETHGVHRTHLDRAGIDIAAGGHRLELVGDGDIAADEADFPHEAEGLRDPAGLDFDLHVAGGDACFIKGRLVHPRRGGVGHRAADHREARRLVVTGIKPPAGGKVVEMIEVAAHAKEKRAPTMAGTRRSSIRALVQKAVRKPIW